MPTTAVFIFPAAAGHINPSLPVAQKLVRELGWQVAYLTQSTFKYATESTGATYHDRDAIATQVGISDVAQAVLASLEQYDDPGAKTWGLNFGSIGTSIMLPVYLKFLESVCPTLGQAGKLPDLLVYCPVLCQAAHFAAQKLTIPTVSLLTAAGPGFFDAAFDQHGGRAACTGLVDTIRKNKPNTEAIESIRVLLGRAELELNTADDKPIINEYYSSVNIVSTIASLADHLWEENARFYESSGKRFEYVGPLLCADAAIKSATVASALTPELTAHLFENVERALAENRRIVYVSMGTVLTSTASPAHGWNATSGSAITGKELCQSVYRAVLDELGAKGNDPAGQATLHPPALVILSIGPQEDALDGMPSLPHNVLHFVSVPQVQLLRKAKPMLALVLTNGGQNSFMEALAVGAPLVVCPGFGDQITNAEKARSLGVAVKVDRPGIGMAEAATPGGVSCCQAYQKAVAAAVCEVLRDHKYTAKAQAIALELEQSGGVGRAVQLCREAADARLS